MRTLVKAGLFAGLFALGAYSQTLTGTISDEHCGAKHVAASDADAACVKKCMAGGAAAVFIAGDKVYKIENQEAAKGFEGQKVSLDGKMTGDSIHIDTIKPASAQP